MKFYDRENELKLLRDMLPRGSRGMIKSNTTFSYSYIDQVLKGKRHNLVIMNKALGIARKIMLSKKMTSSLIVNQYNTVISLFYTSRDFPAGFLSRPALYILRCGVGQRA